MHENGSTGGRQEEANALTPEIAAGPMFDLSALSGAQSVISQSTGPIDPWGVSLLGSLSNLLIYNEKVRFSLPVAEEHRNTAEIVEEPSILNVLHDSMGGDLSSVPYSTNELKQISPATIAASKDYFLKWTLRYPTMLKGFCNFHQTDFIQKHQRIRVAHGFSHDVQHLLSDVDFLKTSHRLALPIEALIYAFDLSLRMPMYGEFAGYGQYYLNHPIRDAFGANEAEEITVEPPPIAVSFAPSFRNLAGRISPQHYASCIMILREKVAEYGLHGCRPGDFEPEILRDLAASAALRPRLAHEAAVAPILATVLSGAVGLAIAGAPGVVFGTSISIAGTIWALSSPLLPSSASNISWLRWALKWDLEREVDKKEDT